MCVHGQENYHNNEISQSVNKKKNLNIRQIGMNVHDVLQYARSVFAVMRTVGAFVLWQLIAFHFYVPT